MIQVNHLSSHRGPCNFVVIKLSMHGAKKLCLHAEEGEKLEKNVEEVAQKVLDKNEKKAGEPLLSKAGPKPPKEERKPGDDEHPELWVPGELLLVCGGRAPEGKELREGHVLLKGQVGTQFGRIVLSSTMLSDHKCISIYYALRDVLKGLPKTGGSDKLSI